MAAKKLSAFRFSQHTYEQLDELKKSEDKFSFENNLREKTNTEIIEDAINFYYNYKIEQKVSFGLSPILENSLTTLMKEYNKAFIDMLNSNQYNLLFIMKEVQLILGTMGISKDDETMKEYLDKDWSFIDLIKDKIYEEKGVYLDEKD